MSSSFLAIRTFFLAAVSFLFPLNLVVLPFNEPRRPSSFVLLRLEPSLVVGPSGLVDFKPPSYFGILLHTVVYDLLPWKE